MRRTALFLVVVGIALTAIPSDGLAARFTPHLDALETALSTRAADVATPRPLAKLFGKLLKKLGKDTTSLSQDVRTAVSIISSIEKKASADAALLAIAHTAVDDLVAAVQGYLAGVEAAADGLRPKDPLIKIDKLLLRARTSLQLSQDAGGTLAARIKALRTALANSLRANTAVVRASGGGG